MERNDTKIRDIIWNLNIISNKENEFKEKDNGITALIYDEPKAGPFFAVKQTIANCFYQNFCLHSPLIELHLNQLGMNLVCDSPSTL